MTPHLQPHLVASRSWKTDAETRTAKSLHETYSKSASDVLLLEQFICHPPPVFSTTWPYVKSEAVPGSVSPPILATMCTKKDSVASPERLPHHRLL